MIFKKYVFPTTIVGIAVISVGISAAVRRSAAEFRTPTTHTVTSWVAYQIQLQEYAGRADMPKALLAADTVRAVRGDGASAESSIYYRLDGSVEQRRRLLKLRGGIRILTNDSLGLMTATRNPAEDEAPVREQPDPSQSCAVSFGGSRSYKDPVVTSESLFGFDTFRLALDLQRYRHTFWRAPSLGCAELRSVGEKLDLKTGQVIATSERTAIDIRPGEPDATLFKLPTGLRNVSPSEAAVAQAQACCNAKLNAAQIAALQSADEHFRKFRYDP